MAGAGGGAEVRTGAQRNQKETSVEVPALGSLRRCVAAHATPVAMWSGPVGDGSCGEITAPQELFNFFVGFLLKQRKPQGDQLALVGLLARPFEGRHRRIEILLVTLGYGERGGDISCS